MKDLLFYFSIACFSLAGLGYLIELIECLMDDTPEEKNSVKPVEEQVYEVNIITDFVLNIRRSVSYKYTLNTSLIQFCREVVKWTAPILRERGIKYFPSISIRYYKTSKRMGLYDPCAGDIIIYVKRHNGDLTEICSTVLHEIMHHIQSKKDPEFNKLLNYKRYGYYHNRIEEEARAFEKQHRLQCMSALSEKGVVVRK